MLSLMDPVEVENIVVFRDDEDARKFYLLPDQPVIAADDRGAPEFLFIRYIKDLAALGEGQPAGGGYVQFRSTLAIDADRRARILDALRVRLEQEKGAGKQPLGNPITSVEPLLADPLWLSGTAKLETFQASDTGLVRHATGSVPADLAGDLGASFAVELDPSGAEVFWSAFQDPSQHIPILITYELTYKARVSARMVIDAKSEVLHETLWQVALPHRFVRRPFPRFVRVPHEGPLDRATLAALGLRFPGPIHALIARPLIREAIHKRILENTITVHIQTDEGAGGEETASIRETFFKIAADILTERLVPALFGSATPQPAADDEDAPAPTQSLLRLDDGDERPDLSFHLELRHDSTVERAVNPNGPVRLLISDPAALAGAFRELRLSDGFFSMMHVTASTLGVNFERDGIAAVHVHFRYAEIDDLHPERVEVVREKDGILKSEADALHWRFDLARRADGGHKRRYGFHSEVYYRESIPATRTGMAFRSDEMLPITPRAMGALRVELVLTARRETVASAHVSLRHRSAAGVDYEASFELTADANRRNWFQYTGDLAGPDADLRQPTYSYQVLYHVDGGEIVTPWLETTAQTLEIEGPFARVLEFQVRPQGSFDGVSSIVGAIVYDHPERGYHAKRPFELAKLGAVMSVAIPVLAGGPEEARCEARVNHSDGSRTQLAPMTVKPGLVWVGDEIPAFLSVQVIPDLLDFEKDVELVVVTLRYTAIDGAVTQKMFIFSPTARTAQEWRVPLADASRRRYAYTIRYVGRDRSTSAELSRDDVDDPVLLLDRKTPTPT
jgi:hypothetical protein